MNKSERKLRDDKNDYKIGEILEIMKNDRERTSLKDSEEREGSGFKEGSLISDDEDLTGNRMESDKERPLEAMFESEKGGDKETEWSDDSDLSEGSGNYEKESPIDKNNIVEVESVKESDSSSSSTNESILTTEKTDMSEESSSSLDKDFEILF
ncbi:hypothetical protein FQA39_LY07288 [Lamprigera yunnana]|nr:hypothetical protein FQA39_LY07288 [Lamprigera yunnana]